MSILPIITESNSKLHEAVSGTGPFSFDFMFMETADIRIFIDDVETLEFTVSGNASDVGYNGGVIYLTNSVTAADVKIQRRTRPLRETSFGPAGAPPLGIDTEFHRVVMMVQDQTESVSNLSALINVLLAGGEVARSVYEVSTFAKAKAIDGSGLLDGQTVMTQGFLSAGDGGHSKFIFEADVTGTGNDLDIVDLTDGSGRLVRQYEDNGVDMRELGIQVNQRTLDWSRSNARTIEAWVALDNGVPLRDGRSKDGDIIWVAPPAALTNGATVTQTGAIALRDGDTLTINGSRTGAKIRQFDFQYCALFALYPGSDLRLNHCRLDQWNTDRDLVTIANYAAGVTVTDSSLSGTGSDSATAIYLGIIQGFGGTYRGFKCEYTNAVYGDVVPDARSRGALMSDLFGYHHDTYSSLHSLGNVSTNYQADATALVYDSVVMDHAQHEDILTETFDIGGGIMDLSICHNRGTRCYTFTANPSHKEVFDIQDVRKYTIKDNDFDLNGDCGTLIRLKGAKNSGGVISGNKARNGLAGMVEVSGFADNGSGKLRVNFREDHGATTGETWVIMGAQTEEFSVAGSVTVIDTDTFDITSVNYTGSENATRSAIFAVKAPTEYVSSNTSDYALDTGVAFTGTELRWNGTAGTIKAIQDDNTALGGLDLGELESVSPLGSRIYLMKVTITDRTAGTLTVTTAASGSYGDSDYSSDPLGENGTFTFLMSSTGNDTITYIGEDSFDGRIEVTSCSMIAWQGAFIVHSNSENDVISENEGSFFFDGLHSLDQGNKRGRDSSIRGNRLSGILNDAIISTHHTNYADLGAIFDRRLTYELNHFTDVYRNAINLGGSVETTIFGGSFQMIGNGACPTVFNNGCEDVLLQGVRFRNGVSLTFDPNLTEETIEFKDCPGFVSDLEGVYDDTVSGSSATAVIDRTPCTYAAVDAAEAEKVYRAFATMIGSFTAGGVNPFVVRQSVSNIADNSDIRFQVFDEAGAPALSKPATFRWHFMGPRKFPIAA